MKYFNFTKKIGALVIVASIFSACTKVETADPIGTRGQTLVKILGGGQTDFSGGGTPSVQAFNIDFVPTPQDLTLVDIRRDIPNATELNKTMNVVVLDDTTALNVYSDSLISQGLATDPIIYLPSTFYTFKNGVALTPGKGGVYNLVFAPGEFAKQISITLADATVLDPSAKYGLAFTIVSADANGVVSASRTLIVTIGAKNQYDGTYHDVWTNYHPSSNPGYTGAEMDVEMWTVSGTAVKIWDPQFGIFANPAVLAGAISAFGGQEPQYTVDGSNNVTVQNTAAGAVTFYTMSTAQANYYDPASRTFHVRWGYGVGYVGVFLPGVCREWTQTLTYTGPR